MNFCTRCGSSIEQSSTFCSNCGLRLQVSKDSIAAPQQLGSSIQVGDSLHSSQKTQTPLLFGLVLCLALAIFQVIAHSEETYDHTSILDNIQYMQDNLNATSFEMSNWQWYLYVYPFLAIIITLLCFASGLLMILLRRFIAPLLLSSAILIFVDWVLYFSYLQSYPQNTTLQALSQISGFEYLFTEFNAQRVLGHLLEKGIWIALISAAVMGLSMTRSQRPNPSINTEFL